MMRQRMILQREQRPSSFSPRRFSRATQALATDERIHPLSSVRAGHSFERVALFAPTSVVSKHPQEVDVSEPVQSTLHEQVQRGLAAPSYPLPHLERIQHAFGPYPVRQVQAHLGHEATMSARTLHAAAYTTGHHVVFAEPPSLALAAHEAAHVIQQRQGVHLNGSVGVPGDMYERQADRVSEAVVRGTSVSSLLEQPRGSFARQGADAPLQGASVQPHSVIQRYQAINVGGVLDKEAYQRRAAAQSRGLNAFSDSNFGRALVQQADGTLKTFEGYSLFGQEHTEERLIREISDAFPNIRQQILGQAPKQPPDAVHVDHIVELYTERQPCDTTTAEPARRGRLVTNGNCHAYLTHVLHPNVPVKFSVANRSIEHAELMSSAQERYFQEIAEGQRRLTFREAEAHRNALGFYQGPIRRFYEQMVQEFGGGSGHYGRDYAEDYREYTRLKDMFDDEKQRLLKSLKVLSIDVPHNLDLDIAPHLQQAFESGEHAQGSDPVHQQMQVVYNEVIGPIRRLLSEQADLEGTPYEKEPPHGPSSGTGGGFKGVMGMGASFQTVGGI